MKALLKRNILVIPCFLVGCATADYNYTPAEVSVSEPPIGEETTVYVGDSMVRQGAYKLMEAVEVTTLIDVGLYELHPGIYVKTGEDKNSETFIAKSKTEGGGFIEKDFIADPPQAVMVKKASSEICVISVFSATDCAASESFKRTLDPAYSRDAFQQTLIYSGKVGDKINIGYREFSSDYARPAFNNDVEYDLSDSRVIGYKGARLEVIEANNESITFKLISNFSRTPFTKPSP